MKKYQSLVVACIVTFLLPLKAMASECGNDCQKELVDSYFSHLSVIYRKGSGEADIQNLFRTLHPAVSYEHLTYEAKFNTEEWRSAFLNNLQRGAYKSEEADQIRVDKTIHGRGYMAVSYSYGAMSEEGSWQEKGDQNLLALFKIKDGKIISVKEYW